MKVCFPSKTTALAIGAAWLLLCGDLVQGRRAFVRQPTRSNALRMRGGGSNGCLPWDPKTVVKTASVFGIAHGVSMMAGPKLMNTQFGICDADNTPVSVWMTKQLGTAVTAFSVVCYFLIAKKASLKEALLPNLMIWFYVTLENLLSGNLDAVGFGDKNVFIFTLASMAVMMYCLMRPNGGDAIVPMKVWAVLWTPVGLQDLCSPVSAGKAWGHQGDTSLYNKLQIRCFGCYLLAMVTLMGSQLFYDVDVLKSIGLGALCWDLYIVIGLVNGDFAKVPGLSMPFHFFWLFFHSLVAYSTLS